MRRQTDKAKQKRDRPQPIVKPSQHQAPVVNFKLLPQVMGAAHLAKPETILQLQRLYGNRTINRLLAESNAAEPASGTKGPSPALTSSPVKRTNHLRLQATPVIQRGKTKFKSMAGFKKMSLFELYNYETTRQMDWANNPDPGFSKDDREAMWDLVKLARSVEISRFTNVYIKDISLPISAEIKEQLWGYGDKKAKIYSVVPDFKTAMKWGRYIQIFTKMMDINIHDLFDVVMPSAQFQALLDKGYEDRFIDYYQTCQPTLMSAKGEDVQSIIAMFDKGVDYKTYSQPLSGFVRNIHRFSEATLKALVQNVQRKDKAKPVTLVIQGIHDPNAAYHQDEKLDKLFEEPRNLTLLLEVPDIAQATAQIPLIAQEYGQIKQVLISGHGQFDHVKMGTQLDFKQRKYLDEKRLQVPQSSAVADPSAAFFAALNQLGSDDQKVRVVLNACLTGANNIDPQKIAELTGLDINQPLQGEDLDKVRVAAQTYIKQHPSLATYIRQNYPHLESQGVIGSLLKGSDLIASTGQLEITSDQDKAIAGKPEEYIKDGLDPAGVIRSIIEVWAFDNAKAGQAVDDRLLKSEAGPRGLLIKALCQILRAHYWNNLGKIYTFLDVAQKLDELLQTQPGHCKFNYLKGDEFIRQHFAEIAKTVNPTDEYTTLSWVLLQVKVIFDLEKIDALVPFLARGGSIGPFEKYIDLVNLGPKIAVRMNPLPAREQGWDMLALLVVAEQGDFGCKEYIKKRCSGGPPLPVEMGKMLGSVGEGVILSRCGMDTEIQRLPSIPSPKIGEMRAVGYHAFSIHQRKSTSGDDRS